MLGKNVSNVFIHEQEAAWKRHVQQLLSGSVDTSNVQNDTFNVHENVCHVPISIPENIRPQITSDSNANDDIKYSISLPVNPGSVTLPRSSPKKPIEWFISGGE